MISINEYKELDTPPTPLFLFECTLKTGDVQYWATHSVVYGDKQYEGRVWRHDIFELRSSSDDAADGLSRISISLANADSKLSPIERQIGWRGARLLVRFVFFDLENGIAVSDSRVVFRGIANSPDESTESSLRLSFNNRLNLQRISLPETRIQRRCPWTFPGTAALRNEALSGASRGKYSMVDRCGYAADVSGGCGSRRRCASARRAVRAR